MEYQGERKHKGLVFRSPCIDCILNNDKKISFETSSVPLFAFGCCHHAYMPVRSYTRVQK